ncbi:CDP-diacylglycerol--glycerol-3-phosphate 3-phosphatidyltransferase [Clostridiaceae bacterium M8S5]|nr:CDP-diacylglycerol--glycerol-3-phosphate 3-phosphatidyltransferase [Clostridiaceae bacterium M8S5]
MNIPNILTTIRFALVPVYVLVFFSNAKYSVLYATCIFIIAGITDVLDGYIARKYNMITKWGIILDPLADKTMLVTVILCLYLKEYLPIWVLLFIVIKELAMVFGGALLFWRMDKTVVAANKYGKISTLMFYIAIFIVALNINTILNYVIISVAILTAMLAFSKYLIRFKDIKHNKHNKELDIDKS